MDRTHALVKIHRPPLFSELLFQDPLSTKSSSRLCFTCRYYTHLKTVAAADHSILYRCRYFIFTQYNITPTETMPAIAHLAPRFLAGSTTGGISGTAIALLVCVGVIPAIALIWVCIWLLLFYGNGRNCCCIRRKRAATEPAMFEGTISSDKALNEKTGYTLPQRPTATYSTESGSSTERPRDSRGTLKKHHPRESMQSQWSSNSIIPVVQEPKPFV